MLASFKTNGTGKGFDGLFSNGLQKHKPLHWAQECTLGYQLNLDYCAYFNINKNDDSLYVEIVKLDHKLGKQMKDKAEIVIKSQTPPPKISDNPNSKHCQCCNMKTVCCEDKQVFISCRSCKNAQPVDNAQWQCAHYNQIIPREFIESWLSGNVACEYWKDITK